MASTPPSKRKITDPMAVWERYWRASARSLVNKVRWMSVDDKKKARRCKTSVMVVEMALAIDWRRTDIPKAQMERERLTAKLVEHYLPVALNLAIEKARQTGEDFGEYMAVATEALRDAIPRWVPGKAPFANFVNVRLKWSFHDEVHRGRWSRSVELTDKFSVVGFDEQNEYWSLLKHLPWDQKELIERTFRLRQNDEEIGASMHRSVEWVTAEREVALQMLKLLIEENMRNDAEDED